VPMSTSASASASPSSAFLPPLVLTWLGGGFGGRLGGER
jgi:hypothetical protein